LKKNKFNLLRDIAYSFLVVWALSGLVLEQNADALVTLIAQEAVVVILVALGLSLLERKVKQLRVSLAAEK
jgi:predicted permease